MPGSFRFEPCPNCCVTGCVYESDAFDRADSTSLGAKWTETAGDWSIDTNRLKIVATADAKATCTTTHPTASTKYIVSVSVTLGTDGDIARVWLDDSAFFAEIERITSTCGRLRLYDGAVCKGSVGVALGGYTRLVLCSEGDKVHVGTGGSPMLTVPATVASSIVALGTGGTCTGTVYFEDFSLSKHFDDDATCPACGIEGCTWFFDGTGFLPSDASPALCAADYTTTGTWAYYQGSSWPFAVPCIRCTANGTLTIAPSHPLPSGKMTVTWEVPNWGTEVKAIFSLGGSAALEILNQNVWGSVWGWQCRLMSGGVQYGITIEGNSYPCYTPNEFRLCWDGSVLSASVRNSTSISCGGWRTVGVVTDSIAVVAPQVAVSMLSGYEKFDIYDVECVKHQDDLVHCPSCTAGCPTCAPGTFSTLAQVVIANITSNLYGCTCTDVTIPLTAASSGCQWTGSVSGPCSSGTWSATATVTESGGNYTLTVVVTVSGGVTATFSNTVGSLPDCMTDFDGDVPRVSAAGYGYCTMPEATCTFTSPAP